MNPVSNTGALSWKVAPHALKQCAVADQSNGEKLLGLHVYPALRRQVVA
jgi:hypothetical protein